MREELDKLIEHALADGKITKKEKKILIKKAEKIGVDKDELLMELQAKKYIINREKKRYKSGVFKVLVDFWDDRSRIGKFGIIILVIAIAIVINTIWERSKAPRAIRKIEKALAIYDFEAAREASGGLIADWWSVSQKDVDNMHKKIISTEVSYYTNNGAIETALGSLNEFEFKYSFQETNCAGFNNENYNEEAAFYNKNLNFIINQHVKDNQINSAIEYCNLYYVPKAIEIDNVKKYCGDIWKLDNKERAEKIKTIKNLKK